jgi:cysteine desulfurase
MKQLEQEGFEVTYLCPDSHGFISPESVRSVLRTDTVLISIMHVNNEIGSIQNIRAISKIVHDGSQALMHVDAVQSFGKYPMNVVKDGIDLLSISGHKIHAFKGIGALYIRKGVEIKPLVFGGQQERGIRPGTENMPGIFSLFKAAEVAEKARVESYHLMENIKRELIDGLKDIEGIQFNSHPINGAYSPYILNISFRDTRGEVLLHTLEQRGLFVSTGSACNSKKKVYSHVLSAIGVDKAYIDGTIRLSFSPMNTLEEAQSAVGIMKESLSFLDSIMKRR